MQTNKAKLSKKHLTAIFIFLISIGDTEKEAIKLASK